MNCVKIKTAWLNRLQPKASFAAKSKLMKKDIIQSKQILVLH